MLTVGDLCSLTEQEVHHLPITQPKVLSVRRAMSKFAARNQLNTGSATWYHVSLRIVCLEQFTTVNCLLLTLALTLEFNSVVHCQPVR